MTLTDGTWIPVRRRDYDDPETMRLFLTKVFNVGDVPMLQEIAEFYYSEDVTLCSKAPAMHKTLIRVRNYLNTLPKDETAQQLIDTISELFPKKFPNTRKD